MDALIARIKERVADPLRAVDAATWVCPMPTIAPPATIAEVDAAEVALGFAIPPLLRRLYTEVGNGGFGPNYGLEGVPTIPPVPGTADIVALYQMYSSEPPPNTRRMVGRAGWCRSSAAGACTWSAWTSSSRPILLSCSTAATSTWSVRSSSRSGPWQSLWLRDWRRGWPGSRGGPNHHLGL